MASIQIIQQCIHVIFSECGPLSIALADSILFRPQEIFLKYTNVCENLYSSLQNNEIRPFKTQLRIVRDRYLFEVKT